MARRQTCPASAGREDCEDATAQRSRTDLLAEDGLRLAAIAALLPIVAPLAYRGKQAH